MRKLLSITISILLFIQSVQGATLVSNGNINWNGNWQTTSKADTLHGTTTLGVDSAQSFQSTAWDGNNSNTDLGAMVYIHSMDFTATGTMTVALQQDPNDDGTWTDAVDVSSTTLVFNTTTKILSWYFFKYQATHTETTGTANYRINVTNTGNTSNEIFVRANVAATGNVAVIQVLNATGTLAVGDVTHIPGITQASTYNPTSSTVTMNVNLNGTEYGEINISNEGTLWFSTAAATPLYLEVGGSINVYNGGAFYIGRSDYPIPITSSSTLEFVAESTEDLLFKAFDGGIISLQGADRFLTDSNFRCNTTDAIASASDRTVQTSVNVLSEGWAVNDEVMISNTSTTPGQTEVKTISAVGTSSFTITTDWTNTHLSGSEVVNLTRNVKITRSSTGEAAINSINTSIENAVDIDWVEFNNLNARNALTSVINNNGTAYPSDKKTYLDIDNASFNSCDALVSLIRTTGASSYLEFSNIAVWGNYLSCPFFYSLYGSLTKAIITNVSIGGLNEDLVLAVTSGVSFFYATFIFNNLNFYDRINNSGVIPFFDTKSSDGKFIFNNSKIWALKASGGLGTIFSFSGAYGTAYSGNITLNNCILGGDGTNTIGNGTEDITFTKGGVVYANNTQFLTGSGIGNFSYYPSTEYDVARISSHNHGGTQYRYKTIIAFGNITDNTTTSMTAHGGSGTCAVMNPLSSTSGEVLSYIFNIPVTAATDPQLQFYIRASGGTPSLNIDVYDSDDDSTLLLDNASLAFGSPVTDWTQKTITLSANPTDTGYCRVVLKALDDGSTRNIGLDTLTYVLDGVTYTVDFERWKDALPDMAGENAGTAGGGGATIIITDD